MKQQTKVGFSNTDGKNEEADSKVSSLAFRVVSAGDGLYSAQMLLLVGDTVKKVRTGTATTLGHAIGAADEALDGWAFSEIETTPEDFFQVILL